MKYIDDGIINEKFQNLTKQDYKTLSGWSTIHRLRLFDAWVFLGAGSSSANDVAILHARLERAMSILGGWQQGRPIGEEEIKQHSSDMEALHEIVEDFAAAIVGKRIEFKEELDYPPKLSRSHPLETLEYLRQNTRGKREW